MSFNVAELSLKIVIISDTHQQHREFGRLDGDVLIHCGDMFNLFGQDEQSLEQMDEWFGEQDFELVLCTGGNHDLELQSALERTSQPFENAVYLQDDTHEYGGKVFWGAPWVPELSGHAFFATEATLAERWSRIPSNVDVLITHTPPQSILDVSSSGHELGCPQLLAAVRRVEPVLHCFGHIHDSRGMLEYGDTTFVNASSVVRGHFNVRPPIVIEV